MDPEQKLAGRESGGRRPSQGFSIDEILRAKRRQVKSSDGESLSSSPTPPNSPLPLSLLSLPPPPSPAHYLQPLIMSPTFLPRPMHYSFLLATPPLHCYPPRPLLAPLAAALSLPPAEAASEESSDSDTPAESSTAGGETGRKKKRTAFTGAQLQELEASFRRQKYLTKTDRVKMAKRLGLTEKHVKTWYQNRRTKWKRGATELEWSAERERSATVMYQQFVSQKNRVSSLTHTVFQT